MRTIEALRQPAGVRAAAALRLCENPFEATRTRFSDPGARPFGWNRRNDQ